MSSARRCTGATGPLYPYDLAKAKSCWGGRLRQRLHGHAASCWPATRTRPPSHGAAADVGAARREARASSRSTTPPAPTATAQGDFQMRLRPGPTTSPTRARSPPTSSTTPTSRRCTRAGRTTRSTSCSSRASSETRPGQARGRVQADPGDLQRERRRSSTSTRRPIRWRCSKKVQGLRADPARQQHLRARPRSRSSERGCAGSVRPATVGRRRHPRRGARCRSSRRCILITASSAFVLVRLLPGDPASAMLGDRATRRRRRAHQRRSSGSTSRSLVQFWLFLVRRRARRPRAPRSSCRRRSPA